MGKLLTADELEGAKPLLSDSDLEGASLSTSKSKYPSPKSFSASDQDLGLVSDAAKVRIQDVGLKRFLREVIAPSVSSEEDHAIASGDLGAVSKEGERVLSALGGIGAVGKAVKAAASAAPKAGLASYQELMKTAIAKTAANGLRDATIHSLEKIPGLGPALGLVAGKAADAAPPLARGAVAAAKVVAPVVAAPAGNVARGAMSNAIERLRASSAGNPRAQELLRRIDAIPSPDFGAGTNTVTQGTLGE